MKYYLFLSLSVAIVLPQVLRAQTDAKHFNTSSKKIGAEGYDLVAYFSDEKAVEGEKDYKGEYSGITYLFSSEANAVVFSQNPKKYLPQYGGWCAYAMGATGDKVEVDPETFKIVDGKLYLFYNKYFNNTLKQWNEDEASLKRQADTNWSKIIAN
ncbi:MAG: YHS domain-containing (seleno)protein [Bacteroidota bacterium]